MRLDVEFLQLAETQTTFIVQQNTGCGQVASPIRAKPWRSLCGRSTTVQVLALVRAEDSDPALDNRTSSPIGRMIALAAAIPIFIDRSP
jgi:hypothetical protein